MVPMPLLHRQVVHEAGRTASRARHDSERVSRVVGVNGGRASRSGAQPQASTERVSTRRSAPLTSMQRTSLPAECRGMFFPPAPLPFGENGVPRGSASWSRPQAAKARRTRLGETSIPGPASPVRQDRPHSSARGASCGYWRCAPAPFHVRRVAPQIQDRPRCG
ncbi:hypothetical protein D3C86_594420 [compost metagenome]